MRKYRGKRVDNGEWVYGYLIGTDVIVGEIVEFNDEYFNTEFWYKVDPKTVGQYTGLKDKNGVEIYEGDILDGSYTNPMSNERVEMHYRIVFRNGNYYAELMGHHPYGTTLLYFENQEGEVIGNIYEHPHLQQGIPSESVLTKYKEG